MWRTTLKTLITSGEFRTQVQLVEALSEAGHDVSQGTVSRELNSLGVDKVEGVYRLPGVVLGATVHSLAVNRAGSLAVLKTDAAFAGIVAHYVDQASVEGVLGTLAGEDTVFVALFDASAGDRLAACLGMRRR